VGTHKYARGRETSRKSSQNDPGPRNTSQSKDVGRVGGQGATLKKKRLVLLGKGTPSWVGVKALGEKHEVETVGGCPSVNLGQ